PSGQAETYDGRSHTCAPPGAMARTAASNSQACNPRRHAFGRARAERSALAAGHLHKAFHGEFDPGSGRTLAACLTHASRAERPLRGYSSGERVSNTWTTYLSHRNTPGKPGSMPDKVQLRRALYQR